MLEINSICNPCNCSSQITQIVHFIEDTIAAIPQGYTLKLTQYLSEIVTDSSQSMGKIEPPQKKKKTKVSTIPGDPGRKII